MNKNKTIILLVIGILIVITLSIGVTYSFMLPKVEKENNQTDIGINNCAKITLKDNNSTINLKNTYPMEEEMGLQTEPYEFTISSTCEEYTGFNLYILTYEENEISDDLIRYGITSKKDTLLETNLITKEEASDITDEEKNEINQGVNKEYKKIYKVYSNNIPLKGESEYKLHIWIDEKAENDTMGESIKLGVVVKGYSREETLAEYLIAHKDNTLIYHDGLPDYEGEENSELEAGDYSYRYAGGNDVVNNYVCLDGKTTNGKCSSDNNLYRIIGLFKNDINLYEMKLIKYDYASKGELGDLTIQGGAFKGNYSKTDDDVINYKGNDIENVANYYWNNSDNDHITDTDHININMWKDSNLNKVNLNNYFYNYLISTAPYLQKHIISHTWVLGALAYSNTYISKQIFDSELNYNKLISSDLKCYNHGNALISRKCNLLNDILYQDKIGIIYINDYLYAAFPKAWNKVIAISGYDSTEVKENNWLYMGLNEWTLTRDAENGEYAWAIHFSGTADYVVKIFNAYGIRPTFYLDSNTELSSGEGTITKPYIISQ